MSFDSTPPPAPPQPPAFTPPPAPPTPSGSPLQAGAPAGASTKSFIATWLLSYLLGLFGADRFYLGKIGTGIIKLVTLGGIGVWWLVDIIITLTGNATDSRGLRVSGKGKEPMIAWIGTAVLFALGIILGAVNGASSAAPSPGSTSAIDPAASQEQVDEEPESAQEVEAVEQDLRPAVPSVVGMTIRDGRAALEGVGLMLSAPEGASDDAIIETQSVPEGQKIDEGSAVSVTATEPEPVLTLGQQNAIGSAQNYLDFTGFSRSGLIGQLEYEGFSTEDATFAVDYLGADWNAEAAEKAQSYLEFSSFSRQGLSDQLAYEGFTPEQIEYALGAVGY